MPNDLFDTFDFDQLPIASDLLVAARDEVTLHSTDVMSESDSHAAARRLLARLPYRLTPRAAQLVALRPTGGAPGTIMAMMGAGRLVIIQRRVERPIATSSVRRKSRVMPLEQRLETPKSLSWIRFRVVHHATGDPFVGVRLAVRTPSGLEVACQTNAAGMASIDEINPGTCDVWCPLKSARLARTVAFVGMGEPASRPQAAPGAPLRSDWGAPAEWIAHVDEHRVQTGESLQSIAERNSYSWQELAEFNWGTSIPDEVNRHLRDDVGCSFKTRDGINYRFTSQDEPGLIYIPRPWSQSNLPTEQTHVFRVRLAAGFRLILENQDHLRIPEADYEATLADGIVQKGRLGRSGVALIKDPPPGPVEVLYPDLDDIEAKSLAACARRAMDDRDLDEIFRVLKHSRWMIRQAIAMYDKYFNDYTGEGLLADIDHEATDASDRAAIEALLRIAALHAEPGDANRSTSAAPAEVA